MPTDIGIKSTNYSFEYDPVGDAPQYWGNPLAMLNALAAFEYVHGYYLSPNANGDARTRCRTGTTTPPWRTRINEPANG